MALKPLCARHGNALFLCGARFSVILNLFQDLTEKPTNTSSHKERTANNKGITKLLRVMKLIAIFLVAACMQVCAKGYTQTVSLQERNAKLEDVFHTLKKQTGLPVLYTRSMLKDSKRVTVNLKNVSLQFALDEILKDQGLDYSIVNNTIVIKTKEADGPVSPGPVILNSFQELIDVSGRVTDNEGNALAGASVKVKGTTIGTTTNADGSFTLKGIDENAILVFSYAEHETTELKVSNRTTITAALKRNESPLDEIQVVAYGTKIKREQIGNVSTVNAKDIAKQPVNNVLLALADRVPGLFITQANGLPGSGVKVTLQGVNSLGNGFDPFYVIDGVPYTSQLLKNYGEILGKSGWYNSGNPLSFLNPADIESISVLKDADATAIYGSRGANGVILITTKKGKAGATKVDVNIQTGWGRVTRTLDLLNTQQYLEMRLEAKRNDNAAITATDYDLNGLWDKTRNTDWQKELIGNTAQYTDVNVTVSGGNANTQVLAGMGYHKETTVFPGDLSDQKGSLHFSMNNVSNNQKFRFQLSGNYLEDNNRIISRDLTEFAISISPIAPPIYDDYGQINWMPNAAGTSTWTNPLSYLHNKYQNKTKNLVANAIVGYQIIPGLEIKSSLGYSNLQSNDLSTTPLISYRPENRLNGIRVAFYSNNNISSWQIEPQITYKRAFRSGQFDVLVGTTIQQSTSDGLSLRGEGYNSDIVLEDIKSASLISIEGNVKTVYKYNALFTRLGYTLLDKYLVNLTARRDGSSRFGSGNQFHNFGAIGTGWIFSKEKFIQNVFPFLSFGKISGSYGTTGNDQIGDYRFMSLYYSLSLGVPYQGANGMQPSSLANAFLQWEETKKLNLRLDLGLFKDRINITSNYFRNLSTSQLLNYDLPIQTGFNNVTVNFPATIQNAGWEFTLNTSNIKSKDFTWSSYFNLTIPKNELLKFSGIEKTSYANSYAVGEPITRTKLYRFAGVNPTTGVYQFFDSKGNVTASPISTDRNFWVNTAPELYAGLQNNFRYRNFELDFSFQFVKRRGGNYFFGNPNGAINNRNQPALFLERWQRPGDNTSIQRYNSNFSLFSQTDYATQSDAAYSDASFARLKNLSLSWNMPQSWYSRIKLKNARIYVHGQNLLTFTKYPGLDPETLSSTTLPPLKVLTFGLQVGL